MLDLRADSIVYQAQSKVIELTDNLITKRRLAKKYDKSWDTIDLIIMYLEAYEERFKLDDITQMNYILECLIKLAELNEFPAAPTLTQLDAPSILIGIPGQDGSDGDQGPQGEKGDTGLATDFQSTFAIPTPVDNFLITDAKGARWDYVVTKSTGERRVGSIIGTWLDDGSALEFNDNSSDDLTGSTSGLEFDVQYNSGSGRIQLVANPTSGSWTVIGTRYFIPNNGNGTGPISGILQNGYVYIGNTLNQAQERLLYGDVTVDNTGLTSITSDSIVDNDIYTSAGIQLTKLQQITANSLVGTNASGWLTSLTTLIYPSLTEISYVKGVTLPIQTQINSKMSDPMTSIGDIIIRNGSNVTTRLGAGSANQVLTISGGIPSWQTPSAGFADPMTSIGDIIIRNGSNVTTRLGIGSANQVLTVSGGVPTWQTPSAGFSDPMTTAGDIIIRNGSNVTTRLAAGSVSRVLTIVGGVPAWSAVSTGVINELPKDNGIGSLTNSYVYASGTSSNPTLTLGSGTPAANIASGSGGNMFAIVGTDQSFNIRNFSDTQRLGISFVSSTVFVTASGGSINSLSLSAPTQLILGAGSRQVTINTNGAVYGADYSGSYTTRSLVDVGYINSRLSSGTGTLTVSTVSASTIIGTTGTFTTLGVGTAYDGVNPLTINGSARQYVGSFQIDTGSLRMGTTGDNLSYSSGVFTLNPSTNFVINKGIGQGTGVKHARVSTGTVSGSNGTVDIVVTWGGSAFADVNYSVVATTEGGITGNQGISVMGVIAKTTTTTTVRVINTFVFSASATLNIVAIHD